MSRRPNRTIYLILLGVLCFGLVFIHVSCAEETDYHKFIGTWKAQDGNPSGFSELRIHFDNDRESLFITLVETNVNPLFYDRISGNLRFRIVGLGPISDLQELRFSDGSLIHYGFDEQQKRWVQLRTYQKVNS